MADTAGPGPETGVEHLHLLAVDVETTGLNPRRDEVLSIGWVPVDGREIVLAGARRTVVRPDGPEGVGQSAVHHGLTDDVVASGLPRAQVLDRVLEALRGRVLLAHHARIELDFLQAALRVLRGRTAGAAAFHPPAIDTMELAARVLRRAENRDPGGDELRLGVSRAYYGLPATAAHDALHDALACAELYLAQSAELAEHGDHTLADLRLRR